MIQEATQRAAKIVSNVLSFGAEGALETQGVEVRAILERAVGLNRHQLMADNINVTLRISPDLPAINIDPFIMVQAFLNIITNAWQAMKEAHGEGELVIHADRSGDRVRIIFEDNGPGISPEHIGRIFDPFFTTKEVGEGTGLGLSVTHGIVRRHGGEIWAESVLGKGASIYVEIPLAPLYEAEMAEPLAAELEQVAEIKPRVLIVNDEAAFRELLSISLSEDGRQVDSARNAEEAWDMVQSQHYDCMILNLWMPWMNGQTLYYRIKEYSEELAQSCIFVTGAHRSQGVQEFLAATGNLSLSKPFSLREIRQLVVHTLGLDDI